MFFFSLKLLLLFPVWDSVIDKVDFFFSRKYMYVYKCNIQNICMNIYLDYRRYQLLLIILKGAKPNSDSSNVWIEASITYHVKSHFFSSTFRLSWTTEKLLIELFQAGLYKFSAQQPWERINRELGRVNQKREDTF